MKLYYELGYDCLSIITIRKDFNGEDFSLIQKENIGGFIFEIKKIINNKSQFVGQ